MPDSGELNQDTRDSSRIEGIKKMSDVFGKKAFEYLVINLWDESKYVRMAAADALGDLHDERARNFLAMFINDTDMEVRHTITVSLGKIHHTNQGNISRTPEMRRIPGNGYNHCG